MINRLIAFILFFTTSVFAQTVVTTTPTYPTSNDSIVVVFDASKGTAGLKDFTGDVYAHTGVITEKSANDTDWKYVIAGWTTNVPKAKMTSIGNNLYKTTIKPNPKDFYGVPSGEKILKIAFVFRSADSQKEGKDTGGKDIFIPLYSGGIKVGFNTPTINFSFGDPLRSPVFVSVGGTVPISVTVTEVGTTVRSVKLFINGTKKAESSTKNLLFTFTTDEYSGDKNEVKVVAEDVGSAKDSSTFVIMKNPVIKNLAIPFGSQIGVNYNTGVLAFYAPGKKFVYLIGDHSDWKVDAAYFMNRDFSTSDSLWWIGMPSMTADPPGEIAYQFLIDGSLRIYDPYTDKILDPNNDPNISPLVYPNLKSYPKDKTSGIVSVLQPSKSNYNWNVTNFSRPAKEKLVIYEMLVRDFVSTHSYTTLVDTLSYFKKLGVNAIELMPISEFEGNDSWGYNPTTYFAPDKYYGTKDDLKKFIDACHQNGIAVIQDIVLNHAYNSNSMAQMYWNNANNRPAANNPWFNVRSNFLNPDAQWGNDFNHESLATQYFVDRVLQYWLTEFKIDGFRFDFTKGFGNNQKPSSGDIWASNYDADRIRLLKRMVDKVWSYDPTAIMIFEHLAENREDQELAQYGILMWGNMNYNYNEATMGYVNTSNFGGVSYKSRSWSVPNLVGYMESHDEERLIFKNLQYGNSSGSYNIKNLQTALNRIKLAATFFITVPGPKMIWQFGELGYDISINQAGRLGRKPLPWADSLGYYSSTDRKSLFNTFAALNRLKRFYPAFSSTDFTLNASGATKSLYINHSSMKVAVIGNFDVVSQSASLTFQNTGKWYEFFSGDSLTVTNVNMQMNLLPGEYRLYTSNRIPKASDLITAIKQEHELPAEFRLEQNYPNPFNPETVISYQLPVSSYVTLKIYDLLGREVATLVNEVQPAGIHHSQFSILNYALSSGVYLYRIEAGNFVQSKKMLLIK
ncbi:alpha-amylase [bacterium]|nr:alpha-amylase [bacterium]